MSGAELRDVRQHWSEEALDMSTKTYVDSPVSDISNLYLGAAQDAGGKGGQPRAS